MLQLLSISFSECSLINLVQVTWEKNLSEMFEHYLHIQDWLIWCYAHICFVWSVFVLVYPAPETREINYLGNWGYIRGKTLKYPKFPWIIIYLLSRIEAQESSSLFIPLSFVNQFLQSICISKFMDKIS